MRILLPTEYTSKDLISHDLRDRLASYLRSPGLLQISNNAQTCPLRGDPNHTRENAETQIKDERKREKNPLFLSHDE